MLLNLNLFISIISLKFESFFLSFTVSCDIPYAKQFGFQDPATAYFEGIIDLHHDLMFFMVLVTVFVSYMLLAIVFNFGNTYHTRPPVDIRSNSLIEIVWTIIPGIVILSLALPTFALIYSMEEVQSPTLSIRAIGNQWYWNYEYSDFERKAGTDINKNFLVYLANKKKDIYASLVSFPYFKSFIASKNGPYYFKFSSNMIQESDIDLDTADGHIIRLLSTDNVLLLPSRVLIRINVTANDVIHSWTIPSFGIKLDGTPGRTNSATFLIKRNGTFYGQCSEICGIQHAFMPIQVKVVSPKTFLNFVLAGLSKI
jgi:cytochrome c oxidase subunit 2